MARFKKDVETRSFTKGLITEATGLTYPEGSSRDLDNVDIDTDGSVRRRLGIAQERDGVVIGTDALSDTLFTNDTGGPLSLSPSVTGATVTKSYDGVTGNGDWTLGGFSATITSGAFSLDSQSGSVSYMQQDLSVSDYDRITLSWDAREVTSNEGQLLILVGATVGGAGQGVEINSSGIRAVTTSGHNTGYVEGSTLFSYNAEGNYSYIMTLAKTGTNAYVGTVQVKLGTTVVKVVDITVGTSGDYIEFLSQSGQHHRVDWRVDNIGITLEVLEVSSDLPDTSVSASEFAISTHAWPSPNGDGTKGFQVTQIGNRLYFRDAKQTTVSATDGDVPLASQELSFDGIGTGFIYNTTSALAAKVKLQSAPGFGRLWFTSRATIPFYAELAEDGESIRLRAVGTRDGSAGIEAVAGQRIMRDLLGVDDGLEPSDTPATLSPEHLYNLINQGWPSDKINDFFTSQSNYPANGMQWWYGKKTDTDFDPTWLVEQQEFGSTTANKGRIMFDALLGDRDGQAHAVSGVTSPIDFDDANDAKSSTGWEAVAFFAGRVCLAGDVNAKRPGCLYMSKVLEGTDDAGKFYQVADPASEHINNLVATDGLVIPIPEAGNIRRLVPFGAGLMVLADTGVWFVYGRQGGFAANNYSVEKLTNTGTIAPDTVVKSDQQVVYWAENSIHVAQFTQDTDRAYLPVISDIGERTIFRHYQLIPRPSRQTATSCYDPITKKCIWFWLSDGDLAPTHASLYDRCLILDTRTGAFTKYSFTSETTPLLGVACAFPRQTPTEPAIYEPVYDSLFATVVDSFGDTVYGPDGLVDLTQAEVSTSIKLVVADEDSGGVRIAEFSSLSFADFEGFSGFTPVEATAFIETGDETVGDLQRNKQATWVSSFFRRTESGFYPDQTLKRASGATFQAKWDWTSSSGAGRWSDPQQAYRFKRAFAPAAFTDPFPQEEEIVFTKLKVRGRGRAVRFRYTSVEGKDMRLLSFAIPVTIDGVP